MGDWDSAQVRDPQHSQEARRGAQTHTPWLSPPPKESDTPRPFKAVEEEYIAWGVAQGERGGRPWGPTHAASRRRHLPWWREQLNLKLLSDLEGSLPRAEKALRELQEAGRAGKTLANYAESLCAFCDWCIERGYLEFDPLKRLKKFDQSPMTKRRALTEEEVQRLLAVAPFERRLLYALACSTGLRVKEIRSLTPRHVDQKWAGLILDAAWTKNRKEDFQPVPSSVLLKLVEACKGKAKDEPLLHVPSHTARSLDLDLKAADISKTTHEGKIDFHALRTTFTTLVIESGANPKEAQKLLRHSTVDMTMNTYARARSTRVAEVSELAGQKVNLERECAISVQRAVVGGEAGAVNPSEGNGLRSLPSPKDCGFDSRLLHHINI